LATLFLFLLQLPFLVLLVVPPLSLLFLMGDIELFQMMAMMVMMAKFP